MHSAMKKVFVTLTDFCWFSFLSDFLFSFQMFIMNNIIKIRFISLAGNTTIESRNHLKRTPLTVK